jgi:hypothetical protein
MSTTITDNTKEWHFVQDINSCTSEFVNECKDKQYRNMPKVKERGATERSANERVTRQEFQQT